MNVRIFKSSKGDCLLLESSGGVRMLVDGGMAYSYRRHVARELSKMRLRGEALDIVYVSHIDQDHISGVLQLLDDEVAWRRYDYLEQHGDGSHRRPKRRRPPEVKAIWHNAFADQVRANQGDVEALLAASAATFAMGETDELTTLARFHQELGTSIREALQVSDRIGADQLKIPLNTPAAGKLMMLRANTQPFAVDDLGFTIIGPRKADMDALRKKWDAWLKKNPKTIAKLRKEARDAARNLDNAEELGADVAELIALREVLGDRDHVSAPNLASLMLLVEEGDKSILLTGDGHHADVLNGLRDNNRLDAEDRIHVDVLKVPHHGSEHNTNLGFYRKVTADHYVFCGNGAHDNPDTRVVQALLDARLGNGPQVASHPEAGKPFKLWFSSAPSDEKGKRRRHLDKVEAKVKKAAAASGGRLTYTFSDEDFVDLDLSA